MDWVGFVTALTRVTFVEIRAPELQLAGLDVIESTILDLPFEDRTLGSVSCLHVAEHVGLGRYGDPLDPEGTPKAAAELSRVLAPGGQLLFSVPVGRSRVCFNAHRVHSPHDVVHMFDDLELVDFAGVTDDGTFHRRLELGDLEQASYGCGLFAFTRPEPRA